MGLEGCKHSDLLEIHSLIAYDAIFSYNLELIARLRFQYHFNHFQQHNGVFIGKLQSYNCSI